MVTAINIAAASIIFVKFESILEVASYFSTNKEEVKYYKSVHESYYISGLFSLGLSVLVSKLVKFNDYSQYYNLVYNK
jgi:hypothetical protein